MFLYCCWSSQVSCSNGRIGLSYTRYGVFLVYVFTRFDPIQRTGFHSLSSLVQSYEKWIQHESSTYSSVARCTYVTSSSASASCHSSAIALLFVLESSPNKWLRGYLLYKTRNSYLLVYFTAAVLGRIEQPAFSCNLSKRCFLCCGRSTTYFGIIFLM